MITYLKTMPVWLSSVWHRVSIRTLVADAKYQAQRDLLNADYNAEHWTAQAAMLRGRINRLDAQLRGIL